MTSSNEELQFGDMIELDFTKDTKDGHTCHHHFECKFIPELIPMLLEQKIIEEREVEDAQPDPSDGSVCSALNEALQTIEDLKARAIKIEGAMAVALHNIAVLNKKIDKVAGKNAKKSA